MLQYYIFYKPFQVLTQFSPAVNKKTLADFFVNLPKDVYPAGRLDYDSEGLLMLTNDAQLIHRLLEPEFGHRRTYWVQVDGNITGEALKQLGDGVAISIDGTSYHTQPATAFKIEEPDVPERHPPIRYRKEIPTSWLSLTLTEGKNRQVRRMTAAVGFPTLRLIRYSIGAVTIKGLEPGQYRKMDSSVKALLLRKN